MFNLVTFFDKNDLKVKGRLDWLGEGSYSDVIRSCSVTFRPRDSNNNKLGGPVGMILIDDFYQALVFCGPFSQSGPITKFAW